MEIQYGREYRNLYKRHWWWRAREEAIVDLLRRRVKTLSKLEILDVGCGDALFFDRLSSFGNVEGIEPDSRLIDPANPHRSRIYTLQFDRKFRPGKRYDLILMLDVLEHLDNPEEALDSVRGLLGNNGVFLLTVPAFQILWTNHDIINHHRIRYRKKTLFPLLRKAGFAISEARYWYQWTVPLKLPTHVVEKFISSQPSLPRVPPKWLNRSLFQLSRLEQRTIAPIGIPFGTTLMALCNNAHPVTAAK